MKKILSIIAVASLFSLTACAANEAATLGTTTITVDQLQTTIDQIIAEREGVDTTQMQLDTGATLNRSQLRMKIIEVIFNEIAKELKIEVTATELANYRKDMIDSSGGDAALSKNLVSAQIASADFDAYIRAIVISDKLSKQLADSGVAEADVSSRISELVTKMAEKLKITINETYGTWNNETGDIDPVDATNGAVTPNK